MLKQVLHTDNAPQAIGPYSQGIKAGNAVCLSGQIPLVPEIQQLVVGDIGAQVHQVFHNLQALCEAAGGSLANIVRLTIYLIDLANFALVNEIMAEYFTKPYPARAVIGVRQLPLDVQIEVAETILVVD